MKMTDRSYKTRPTQRRKFSWSMAKMRDESGSAAVEAVIILPALAALYCACFVWFDAFRHNTLSMKATYTVSDILSRQESVDDAFLAQLADLVAFLVHQTGGACDRRG